MNNISGVKTDQVKKGGLEFSVENCPVRKSGLFVEEFYNTHFACLATESEDLEEGLKYKECNFFGEDYRVCEMFLKVRGRFPLYELDKIKSCEDSFEGAFTD
jgi:hypothetical protein